MIGRTSHKLRNAANVAPAWADPFVAELAEDPTYVAGPNGELGAEVYPDDQGVGFLEGDLRGWFWVEAPPGEAEVEEAS
jgi:hypothetical protein